MLFGAVTNGFAVRGLEDSFFSVSCSLSEQLEVYAQLFFYPQYQLMAKGVVRLHVIFVGGKL